MARTSPFMSLLTKCLIFLFLVASDMGLCYDRSNKYRILSVVLSEDVYKRQSKDSPSMNWNAKFALLERRFVRLSLIHIFSSTLQNGRRRSETSFFLCSNCFSYGMSRY